MTQVASPLVEALGHLQSLRPANAKEQMARVEKILKLQIQIDRINAFQKTILLVHAIMGACWVVLIALLLPLMGLGLQIFHSLILVMMYCWLPLLLFTHMGVIGYLRKRQKELLDFS